MNTKRQTTKSNKNNQSNDLGFNLPMLKTIEQMSRISGIGENKLRELIENGELEYIQNGNRRLIADASIWDYYNRNKVIPIVERHNKSTEIMPEI